MAGRMLFFVALILIAHDPAWGQAVSGGGEGVRGINGGVGVLNNLVGFAGNMYVDSQGTQGWMYTFGTFESYSFRNAATGQSWIGSMMTMGPQQVVGLVSGANQASFSLSTGTIQLSRSPTVIPSPPPGLPSLPLIESSFDEIP